MPTNQLAPPDLPGLFMRSIGVPNALGPPDLQRPSMQNTPPLAAPPPTDGTMTPADVWSFNAANLGDAWQAAQNPDTWREAAQNYGQGMLMGSIGPEGKGFTAYHGSPHAFDQFDLSKIGTGEGAQAYGHGMYLADSEGVARSYRDALSPPPMPQPHPELQAAQDAYHAEVSKGLPVDGTDAEFQAAMEARQKAYDNLMEKNKLPPIAGSSPGHMYEVNVNADPAKFLDWDAPLSEQHPDVQAALKPFGLDPNTQGPQILTAIHHTQFDDKGPIGETQRPEDLLRQAGIPGIRYLDRGSRGSGEGTRNSVVFSPDVMNIIRRYGLAGLLGGGAAATQQQGQQQ